MARHRSSDPVFTVLFVCTGNICRSALAEWLARAYLDEALGEDASSIRLVSAGTQAVVGADMHPDTALVLAGFGADVAAHTAQQLVDDLAVDADMVLALTRAHRREALKVAPRGLNRTFTLREAADLAAYVGNGADLAGDTLAERCRALVTAMAAARSRRSGNAADDVADPIGQSAEVHQEVGDLIAEALIPLLARLVSLQAADGRGDERIGEPTQAKAGQPDEAEPPRPKLPWLRLVS